MGTMGETTEKTNDSRKVEQSIPTSYPYLTMMCEIYGEQIRRKTQRSARRRYVLMLHARDVQ